MADIDTVRSYIINQIRHAFGFKLRLGNAELDDDYKLTARILVGSVPSISTLIDNAPDDMASQVVKRYENAHSSVSKLNARISILLDYVDGVTLSKTVWFGHDVPF